MKPKYFCVKNKKTPLPIFFPDATKGVVKLLDSVDITNTKTPGLLVNTWHLYKGLAKKAINKHKGIANFMGWKGIIISDSGGFQVMSVAKTNNKGKIIDKGVIFSQAKGKQKVFTPEDSIRFQFELSTDLMVVLDDFTPPQASRRIAKETVDRTVSWAKRCQKQYDIECQRRQLKTKPYLIGVVQGGDYLDLRRECVQRLLEIGFDGFGYGGWPLHQNGKFNLDVAKLIADMAPANYLLYGLGIGKPEDIVQCIKLGYHIFDCVLPTRDARHRRLYCYKAKSIAKINLTKKEFYSCYKPDKQKYLNSTEPVSTACDCLLCANYSRGYLAHLWRIKDISAMRLSTIHNLRFYSLLMEKLT